jgi:hypothetical protein
MHRLAFLRMAFEHGWSRVRHPAENLSLVLMLLAAFGLPTTIGLLRDAGVVGLAIGLAAGIVGLVFEGSFRLWSAANADDHQAAELRAACEHWRKEVEHFMEIRDAERPPVPKRPNHARRNLSRRVAGLDPLPEPDGQDDCAAREAADAHDRETVGQYIAKFARPGEALFNALVQRGSLTGLDRDRDLVRSPRTRDQIGEALRIIQMGEWGDLRWNPA